MKIKKFTTYMTYNLNKLTNVANPMIINNGGLYLDKKRVCKLQNQSSL